MVIFLSHPGRFTALLLVGLFVVGPALAQQPGACEAARAESYVYVNNVRARILNNGGLFWRGDPFVYEVPKDGGADAIFTAGLWVGGLVNGALRTAATRYNRYEFWPGPLTDDGALPDPNDCSAFDRIYKVIRADVRLFEQTGEVTHGLRDWPWHLGASVLDGDGVDGNYNLAGGDRPQVPGHQALWWVMNDVGNVHESTQTPPLGLEVQTMAFALASDIDAINDATFYRYRLINRGPEPIQETYVGVFADPDLGNFADDYIGSDTTLGLPEPADVRLTIYNVLGQRAATLVEAVLPPGWHRAPWEAGGLASGLYVVYRLEAGSRTVARPMLLVR